MDLLASLPDILRSAFTDWWLTGGLLLAIAYRWATWNHDFWKKRGIKGPRPIPYFGNALEIFFKPVPVVEVENYQKYGPTYGWFERQKPILTIGDPELLKLVMVKDWHLFIDRRPTRAVDDVLSQNLLTLRGERWKEVRSMLSPAFTSGKIKKMSPIIEECVDRAISSAEETARKEGDLDLKLFFGASALDVIASCSFATKTNAHNNYDDPIFKHATQFFAPSIMQLLLVQIIPNWFRKYIYVDFTPSQVIDFFTPLARHIIQERKKDPVKKIDLLQLIVDAESSNDISEAVDDITNANFTSENSDDIKRNAAMMTDGQKTKRKLTDEEAAAQAFVFFVVGFETTATTMFCTGYLLALHPEVQDKLYKEIRNAIPDEQNLDYEEINRLDYLHAVISEALRMYPPGTRMDRQALEDYKLGDTGIVLPKGMIVTLPFYAIQHDPKYYPDPYKFKPERFTKANQSKLTPYTYFPFGAGPRNCIGMRFALWEMKITMCKVLLKYEFFQSKTTDVPLNLGRTFFVTQPKRVTVGVRFRNPQE